MAKTDDREKDQLRIRWQFDGSYIEEMDKSFAERYHLNGDNTSFTISNAQVRDTGTYSCVASNGVDYDNGHTKLTVKGSRQLINAMILVNSFSFNLSF